LQQSPVTKLKGGVQSAMPLTMFLHSTTLALSMRLLLIMNGLDGKNAIAPPLIAIHYFFKQAHELLRYFIAISSQR